MCKVSNLSGYQPMSSFSKTKQVCQSSQVKLKDIRKLKYLKVSSGFNKSSRTEETKSLQVTIYPTENSKSKI